MSRDVIFYEDMFPFKITNKSYEDRMQNIEFLDLENPMLGDEWNGPNNTNIRHDPSKSSGPRKRGKAMG